MSNFCSNSVMSPRLHLHLHFVLLLGTLGSQSSSDENTLGSNSLGHKEAGGDGGGPGPGNDEASSEVKCKHSGASCSEARPDERLRCGGREAAQHQAAQGHSDQALRERELSR